MSLPMLFIHIELKIYVPDGLSDLIDALSDPRAFLSNQEKRRLQQMKAMGVEETDLMGNLILNQENAAALNFNLAGSSVNQQTSSIEAFSLLQSGTGIYLSSTSEFEQAKFHEITIQSLKEDRKFVKLHKKQESKLNELLKHQQDEKQKTLKKQCQQLEKYLKQNNYSLSTTVSQTKLLKKKLAEQQNNSCSSSLNNFFSRPPSSQDESQTSDPNTLSLEHIVKDEQIEQIINEQINVSMINLRFLRGDCEHLSPCFYHHFRKN